MKGKGKSNDALPRWWKIVWTMGTVFIVRIEDVIVGCGVPGFIQASTTTQGLPRIGVPEGVEIDRVSPLGGDALVAIENRPLLGLTEAVQFFMVL